MTDDYSVTVRREIAAPAEDLFDAWLDAQSLGSWLRPSGVGETRAETDPRVGGTFRIVMVDDESSTEHTGTYREIDRPRRLVFTWSSPATAFRDSIVTVTFERSSNGATMVEIHQVGLPDEDARTAHQAGWADILRELDRHQRRGNNVGHEQTRGVAMNTPPIVSPDEWEAARQRLLVKEKELTRARDALAAERRRMPWLAVDKEYEFDGPQGKASLLDLFDGRRQMLVYRAFLEPGVSGWPEHACIGCSMVADQVAHVAHLNARDTTLVFASRAPQADIARVKARMGWEMPWYTMVDGFDTDFGVDEWHGTNAFIRDGDRVFRTYFVNGRGDEVMGNTWSYLDLTALGRQEEWEDSPAGYPQTPPYEWWIWHDEPHRTDPDRPGVTGTAADTTHDGDHEG